MYSARGLHYSYEEYLNALSRSELKLEYCGGEIFAMAGGTLAHAELAAAMIGILRNRLPPGCKVYTSDARLRIEATDLSTSPDASVVCGDVLRATGDAHALANPVLLVEVTSNSTEEYDRGEKLRHYQELESLRHVIFISHRDASVTVVSRASAGWTRTTFESGKNVTLDDPSLTFSVDQLYAGIDLEA